MFDLTNRYGFLTAAILFEGSLIGVATVLGLWLGVDPLAQFAWDTQGALAGLAATVPMFLLFLVSYSRPFGPFRRIKQFLRATLGPALAACHWYDLFLVALVAGIGEELLFRGVLQPKLNLVWSNVLFGLVHSITPAYAVTAGLIGVYLGKLLDFSGNLLAPIVAHAFYDFLAFVVVARDVRRNPPTASAETIDAD
jgi:membrane protease YdiL (CAAX protease family)